MLGFLGVTALLKLRDGARSVPVALAIAPAPEPDLAGAAVAGVALQAGRNGHFFVNALVDGRSLPMMVDTGASACAFSEEDAARLQAVAWWDWPIERTTAHLPLISGGDIAALEMTAREG